MNDEQVYDLFAGIRQINERFGRTANALEATVDKIEETNGSLETVENYLSGIRHALNRIADALENHGTLTFELKTDPSDDEDDDEVEEDGWVETDENGRVVDEGDYK